MNKKNILDKIKSLDGLNNEERAYLVNLVNTKKKYGLVWEDKPEEVEEQLRTKLPILKEVKERAIINDTATEKHPNHILIEGDNLHALTALTFTHDDSVDVIYIDPPYNTGNKDFIYNDQYVDKEDSYRHSKWLSFMHRRLIIASRLLKTDGVIFISIGDDEQSQLKLLCDEVFGENNCITTVPRVAKKTSDKGTYFKPTKDYVLVYAKSISNLGGFGVTKTDDPKKYKYEDDRGKYKKSGASLYQPSLDSRPNQRYWIECPDGSFVIPPGNIFPEKIEDASFIKPINNDDKVWRWSWKSYLAQKDLLIFTKSKTSPLLNEKQEQAKWNIYPKVYLDSLEGATNLPEDIIYDYKNSSATKHLLNMGIKFSFSKPYELVKFLLTITQKNKDITVLDFFAGSGTTAEAVMRLNELDEGNRNSIIVTNNENNIANDVTYERVKRVIKGFKGVKWSDFGPLNNNLRYYQCDFVDRVPSLANKCQLTQLATELLCIKEDCYQEVTSTLNSQAWNKLFTNGKGQFVYVVYDDLYIEEAVEALAQFVTQEAPESKIKVYVFANGQYAYAEEFEDIAENITLAALPDAIYKAYQNVLPKENKEFVPVLEEDIDVEPEMDFE